MVKNTLFSIIPYNFFGLFSGEHRELYADILYYIYFKCEKRNSYSFYKDELLDIIEDYFITHETEEISDINGIVNNNRDKATFVFRRLKACEWISTEYGENNQIIVNLEDYSVTFLNAYINFNVGNSFELSSYVYGMFQSMKSFEIEQGYLTLIDIQQRGKNLVTRLRSLNSNIKKYIKKVTRLDNVDSSEQIKIILDDLLGEYKTKIIDKAYYYMKTNDNPIKYRREFLELCQKRRRDTDKNSIIQQIIKNDNVSMEEALLKYEELMDYLENIFDTVMKIMDDIDRKNTKYINVAIGRIKVILNNDSNIEGLILNILKNYDLINNSDLSINLANVRMLNNNSLYTQKKMRKVKSQEFTYEEPVAKDIDLLIRKQLERSIKFSKESVQKFINGKLNNKRVLTTDDFDLNNMDEFIKLLLVFIYSDEYVDKYKIIWGNEEKRGNLLMPNFSIERVDGNE